MSRLSPLDRVILIAALAMVLGAFVLGNAPSTVRARIARTPLCWSQLLFHRDCPGCGLTRSFMAVGRGSFKEAGELNPLGPILFVGLGLLIITRIGRMASPVRNRVWLWLDSAAGVVVVAALIGRTILFYTR